MGEYTNGASQPLLQFSTVSLHRQMKTLCEWWCVCQGAAGGPKRGAARGSGTRRTRSLDRG